MKKRILDGSSRQLIAGTGSALVDILLAESEEFRLLSGARKGGMTLVEHGGIIDDIVSKSSCAAQTVPGGSACNTLIGIGKLGGPARFIGKRGKDDLGDLFERKLESSNVEPRLFASDAPTGRVLSIVTPDAQRSMLTFLGAASEMRPDEFDGSSFAGAAIVHLEGYLLFNEQLLRAALDAAKEAGALVSLDLASYTVVEASKSILADIIAGYVDIVIANEDESRAYTGEDSEEAGLRILAKQADIAVVKVGKRGSLVSFDGAITRIGRTGDGSAIDTTGAGDLWAAGFLYGLAHGYDIEKAGKIGSACGYEVCRVLGAQIPDEGWERIRKLL